MGYTFKAPLREVSRVFIHCSASDRADDDDIKVIREWHLKRRFSTVGYHLYIQKSGRIQEGRDMEKAPAAQAGHNARTIAICLGGLNLFTTEQFDSLRGLCEQIHAQLPMATFHGHCEVANKTCPVFDYRRVLGLDKKGRLT